MNHSFGKLVGGVVEYAPDVIRVDGHDAISPSEEQLLAVGYRRVTDGAPVTDSEHYATPVGWKETDTGIERVYEVREIERVPRRWTPITLKRGAVARGLWDSLKGILTAADGYDDFVMCQFVAEDDPMFAPVFSALCAQYGEDSVREYLNSLPTED